MAMVGMMTKKMPKKKQQLLETAEELFQKHGIRRISVEEICETSKVSKMTFYKYFPNKVAIAKTILEHFYDDSFQKVETIFEQDISFEEKILKVFRFKSEMMQRFSFEFIKELLTQGDGEIGLYLNEQKERSMNFFVTIFEEAKAKGEIRKDVNIKFILYMMDEFNRIYQDEKFLQLFDSPEQLNKDMFNFMYYGILTKGVDG
jgi:AcrR family transcriptional regulator